MLAGPVFSREVSTLGRRRRFFIARSAYALALLVLMGTAWLVVTGTQLVRGVGDLARFGAVLFQILAPLQLALVTLFSALLAASSVSQEKDRRTLILLLLTRLPDRELVLGKLAASLLGVVALLVAGWPVLMLSVLLGGISFAQVVESLVVCGAAALAAGSLGATVAFWREKTFQTLAITALALAAWLAIWEFAAGGALGDTWFGSGAATWAAVFSPWRAILDVCQGAAVAERSTWLSRSVIGCFVLQSIGVAVLLSTVAVVRLRVWNPPREVISARPMESSAARADERPSATAAGEGAGPGRIRHVWDNPILWRELATWAYGRRVLLVRAIYVAIVAAAALSLQGTTAPNERPVMAQGRRMLPPESKLLVPLVVLGLLLVNAQAVTSLTSERDGRAIDLLLVTDLTPAEFVFGKLGGVLYNTKEMIVLPMLLCALLWWSGRISGENLLYLLGGHVILTLFVAVLGIHVGMSYATSQTAIAVSLATLIFLLLGVATCMRIMIAFSGSFQVQLAPFLAFMLGGGVGLYIALGHHNPSPALGVASFLLPFATVYVITSFIIGYPLAVFLVTVGVYGFTTAAMLIPAIYEFDVATGRTTAEPS